MRRHYVTATFQPKRVDDLQGSAEQFVGYRGLWFFAWVIEDGPYEGMLAYVPHDHKVNVGWVPDCDLADVEYDSPWSARDVAVYRLRRAIFEAVRPVLDWLAKRLPA